MLNNDEQSGMVGLLVGIIVLVFAGIFFSLMADKRFSFSKNRNSISGLIAEERQELENLKIQLAKTRDEWSRDYEPLLGQGDSLVKLTGDCKASRRRLEALEEERDTISAEVKAALGAFSDYQGRYRQQVRSEAVGEKIPELTSRSGRVFKNVMIAKVSAAGIEIRHEEGSSRLLPDELAPSWNERFQWDDGELELHLKNERIRENRHSKFVDDGNKVETLPPPAKPPKKKDKKDKEEENVNDVRVEILRQAVIDTRQRLNQTRTEASRARMEARSSKGRSVPGSLETWAERATRMEAASAKLHAQYMSARGKLAAVAPNDPQLQTQEE